MSGENPNQANSPSQEEVDAALAAAGSASAAAVPDTGAGVSPNATVQDVAAASPSVTESDLQAAAMTDSAETESTAHVPVGSMPLDLPDFGPATGTTGDKGIELISDVELDVKIELGRAMMLIEDVLKLGEGSVVELDKLAGDPVDVFVNDRLVARGEVLVLNDNFCVRVSEIVAGQELLEESA